MLIDSLTPLENKCLHAAEKLHSGVVYGGGMVMLDQVKGTAALIKQNSWLQDDDKEVAVCAALLHKCFEQKRITPGVDPLTMEQVDHLAGRNVVNVIQELALEPEDKTGTKSKKEEYEEIARWFKTLTPAAQEIVMAEKIMNFMTSRDKPNPKKPLSWHKEYLETRMLVVEEGKEVNASLYRIACKTKQEAMTKILQMQKTMEDKGNTL